MSITFPTRSECDRLARLRRVHTVVNEVLIQLKRILESRSFRRLGDRSKNFLRYIVTRQLLGESNRIKQSTIAIAVFGESAEFNALTDSKVRVAGASLRSRLASYYACEGQRDPVRIVLPRGTYVPRIIDRRPIVAIWPVASWTPSVENASLARALSDHLASTLNQSGMVRASRINSARPLAPEELPQYVLRTSVEVRNAFLRLNVSIADRLHGRTIYWTTLQGSTGEAMQLARTVAATVRRVIWQKYSEITQPIE